MTEIAELKKDNAELKRMVDDKKARIAETKGKWTARMEQILQAMGQLEELNEHKIGATGRKHVGSSPRDDS